MLPVLVTVVFALIGIPLVMVLFFQVHLALDRLCVRQARKFCEKNGLKVSRYRWQPAFERSASGKRGVKTEYTLVELDCLDAQEQRRLVVLVVWPFGVRRMMSNEVYPDQHVVNWP